MQASGKREGNPVYTFEMLDKKLRKDTDEKLYPELEPYLMLVKKKA